MPGQQGPVHGKACEADAGGNRVHKAAQASLEQKEIGVERVERGVEGLFYRREIDRLVVEAVVVAMNENSCNGESGQEE